MAKVTSFEELSDVELLDGNDLFYVIDFASKDDKNPVSKKIKYETLLKDMNLSIGFKGIDEISVDNVGKILWIEYEKKSGEQGSISVDLSSLVNIYDTDKEYLYIDGKNTISLSAERIAQEIGKNGVNISYISGTQISAQDTTYQAGNGLELNGTTFSISSDFLRRDETNGKLALSSLEDIKENFKPSSEQYLSSTALDSVSSNWNIAYSRTSADVGSIGYKNSLSTSDILGYTDTTYSVLSNGLSLDLENRISLKIGQNLAFDPEGNLSANEGQVYSAGDGLKLEGNVFSISGDYLTRDEVTETLALSSLSSICGDNITVNNGKLSAYEGRVYSEGKAISIDTENKINVVLSDMINETSNISVIEDRLYVEPSTAKVTYVIWD